MNVCLYRTTQRGQHGTFSFCRQNQQRCGSLWQIVCTAPDIWKAWAWVLGGAMAITGILLI